MSSAQQPLMVLVVDDHRDSVRLTAQALTRAGHTAKTAETCAEALEIARAVKIDVLITDLALADGDGFDLLTKVRRMYPVRSVILSGTRQDEAPQGEAVSVDAYLVKPVDLIMLEATVAALS